MMYGYGLLVATILIGATVLLAILINALRGWWERRRAGR
jgi:hypothetical protein